MAANDDDPIMILALTLQHGLCAVGFLFVCLLVCFEHNLSFPIGKVGAFGAMLQHPMCSGSGSDWLRSVKLVLLGWPLHS